MRTILLGIAIILFSILFNLSSDGVFGFWMGAIGFIISLIGWKYDRRSS